MNLLKQFPELKNNMEKIEDYIAVNIGSRYRLVSEEVNHIVKAGGKRIRPALAVISSSFGSEKSSMLIPLAAIIEIIHMATLVHDDIIDDATIRRGEKSIQSKWGKDVAVFTGDFLLSRAFSLLSENASLDNIRKISNVMSRICEEEINQYLNKFSMDITLRKYITRIKNKTAMLFALSCELGAREGQCKEIITGRLVKIGLHMGTIFQITDDILDFESSETVSGKPVNNDFMDGVYTLPLIYAINHAEYGYLLKSALEKRIYTQKDIDNINRWVISSGGLVYSKEIACRYLKKAEKEIGRLPEVEGREQLKYILYTLIDRKY